MPINGRTAQTVQEEVGDLKLKVCGRLWKGNPKGERSAGSDLQTKFRFESGDRIRELFEQAYGSSYPESVRVYLPYNTTDQVFETWNESYTAQGFQWRCNGDTIVQEMQPYQVKSGKSTATRWQRTDVDKPCLRGDRPVCDDCKAQGRFFFYVRDLYERIGSVQCFMMTVVGIHDVVGFTEQLRVLEAKYNGLMGSPAPSPHTYGMIPYVLTRTERSISRPNGDARAKGKTWTLSISEDPDWLELMQRWAQAQEIQRLLQQAPEVRTLLLPHVTQSLALPGAAIAQPINNGRARVYLEIDQLQRRNGWDFSKVLQVASTLTGRQVDSLESLGDDQLDALVDLVKYPSPENLPKPQKSRTAERFDALRKLTKHNGTEVGAIASSLFNRDLKTSPMTGEEEDRLVGALLLDWATTKIKDPLPSEDASTLLHTSIATCKDDDDLSDESIFIEFRTMVMDAIDARAGVEA